MKEILKNYLSAQELPFFSPNLEDLEAVAVEARVKLDDVEEQKARMEVDFCGVTLPRLPEDHLSWKRSSSNGRSSASPNKASKFVLTPTVRRSLFSLGTALCREDPILVEGPPASGKSSLIDHAACLLNAMDGLIRIHLDDQMDSKTLLGSYVCTDTPGEFVWKEGALTQAVQQGRWIVIEDIDLAPFDVLAAITPLLESNRLYLPARDSSIVAHAGFRLFGTRTVGKLARKESAAVQMIQSLTTQVFVEAWKDEEVREVVGVLFPSLLDAGLVEPIVEVHRLMTSARAETVVDGVRVRRQLTVRDLLKFCRRCVSSIRGSSNSSGFMTERQRELVLKEAVDCFCNMINNEADRVTIAKRLGLILNLHEQKVEFMLEKSVPEVNIQKDHLKVGRVFLDVDSNFLSTR